MKQIWKRTLFYTISTTIIAASVACLLYLIISPANTSHVNTAVKNQIKTNSGSYFDYILEVIPDNIFSPIVNHQVIGVLLVGLVIGVAIRSIKNAETSRVTISFFKGIGSVASV